MTYTLAHIAALIKAKAGIITDGPVNYLLIDSRRIVFPETSLFFAISGPRRNGHQFIAEVYERGVRGFVVHKDYVATGFPGASFLYVEDVLAALQLLAESHRQLFNIPVIGITGSNGKTIVKEWLYQLMQPDQTIVRSPRSYNSQLGVPLSVWQMQPQHTLGIFEAGISTVNEMAHLAAVIQPTIGVFTNLSGAHSEGFENDRQKAIEKAKLFGTSGSLVFCREALAPALLPDSADKTLFKPGMHFFSWSRNEAATLVIEQELISGDQMVIHARYKEALITTRIPFTDRISVNNAITCWCVLLLLEYDAEIIQRRMLLLTPVEMRMELKRGVNNCYILNDSYSNDLSSLGLAIDYLQQQAGTQPTTLILSDILESGISAEALYREIAAQLASRHITRLIGIGPAISKHAHLFKQLDSAYYASTEDFLDHVRTNQFRDEYILLKGARRFEFERIAQWLEQKVHQTVMEIDLSAMVHNLKQYQQQLQPATKVMAMVKAFSYGSGSAEIARLLQFHKVDYLAVAYPDEGVELRKAGISLPVMVMNADEAAFDVLVNYNLEPEIYSFDMYRAFHKYLITQGIHNFPVHIKFNTGMNRLGFEITDAAGLCELLYRHQTMAIRSVFSHLAGSEDHTLDAFTHEQVRLFKEAYTVMEQALGYTFLKHIANSAAIFRHPAYQFDMVRLGIGLYGVDSAAALALVPVATLKTTVAQVRAVKAGDSVGYNRKGVLYRDSLVATVRIGYADGYSRHFGNGAGKMLVQGQMAPVVGSVCMDMTMLDVTDIPGVKEGDAVEVFGKHIAVADAAAWAGTIAYELMTSVSQRVKRVYTEE